MSSDFRVPFVVLGRKYIVLLFSFVANGPPSSAFTAGPTTVLGVGSAFVVYPGMGVPHMPAEVSPVARVHVAHAAAAVPARGILLGPATIVPSRTCSRRPSAFPSDLTRLATSARKAVLSVLVPVPLARVSARFRSHKLPIWRLWPASRMRGPIPSLPSPATSHCFAVKKARGMPHHPLAIYNFRDAG